MAIVSVASHGEFHDGDPVLAVREVAYDTVTGKTKVGDGTTPFSSLPDPPASGPSGGSTFWAAAHVSANSAPDTGSIVNFPIKDDGTTIVAVPMSLATITAGASNGIGVSVIAPAFSAGTLVVKILDLYVTNPDGTQKRTIGFGDDASLTTGQNRQLNLSTGVSVVEQIGTDLVTSADHETIDSTAGGQLSAVAVVQFTATGLVA